MCFLCGTAATEPEFIHLITEKQIQQNIVKTFKDKVKFLKNITYIGLHFGGYFEAAVIVNDTSVSEISLKMNLNYYSNVLSYWATTLL